MAASKTRTSLYLGLRYNNGRPHPFALRLTPQLRPHPVHPFILQIVFRQQATADGRRWTVDGESELKSLTPYAQLAHILAHPFILQIVFGQKATGGG